MAEVHEAMVAVTKAVSHIAKKRSEGVSYEFRGIDEVMNHLHGPLAENGLILSPRVLDDWQINMIPGTNNRQQTQALFRICIDVYASDGSMVILGPGLAQSHDYGDKAVYQAQQNAIKYLLLEAFAIPTAEADMDGREADPVPASESIAAWLKRNVATLSKWSDEERKQAYKAVMTELELESLSSMEDAEKIHKGMTEAYYLEFPPAEGEAPF